MGGCRKGVVVETSQLEGSVLEIAFPNGQTEPSDAVASKRIRDKSAAGLAMSDVTLGG